MSRQRHRYVAARPLPPTSRSRLGPRRWAYHQPVHRRSTLGTAFRWLVWLAVGAALLTMVATLGYKLWVDAQTEELIYSQDDPNLPQSHVAIVFGAGLNRAGGPSPILRDRVETAADLYHAGMVEKLLMTGDNSSVEHNEVEAMRQTAIELGVADADIVLDYAGFNTWDSCYRAREVFSLAEATLITQRFHLPRAVHTCNELGVNSVGVAADRQSYATLNNELREYVALAGTAVRFLTEDKPRFLGPKINVDEPQER
jgi:vancomycin permeability regulator SanA